MDGLAALIPTATTLFSVYVGTLLNVKRERRNWLRDKRLVAYEGVLSGAREMLWAGAEIDAQRTDRSLAEQREKVRQAMFSLREALARVDLVASDPVRRVGRDLEGHFGNVLYPHFRQSSVAAVEGPPVQRARQLMVAFLESSRRDVARV